MDREGDQAAEHSSDRRAEQVEPHVGGSRAGQRRAKLVVSVEVPAAARHCGRCLYGRVPSNVLYDDGKVVLDEEGVTLRRYYFPPGTSKRIRYAQIQQVRAQPMGWLTGKGRGWGSAHPGYWLPLDVSRPRKSTLIVLEVGGHVKPSFSPDDPEEVLQALRQRTNP